MTSIGYVLKNMVADFRNLHGANIPVKNFGVGNIIGVPLSIRLHIEGDDYVPVSQYLAGSPQAVRQVLRLMEIVDQHELAHLATVDELVVGEDDSGAQQLEIYIRVAANQDTFRSFKNDVHNRFVDSFIWDRHEVWPVIIRKS